VPDTVKDTVILTRSNGGKHLARVEGEGVFRSLSGTIGCRTGIRMRWAGLLAGQRKPKQDTGVRSPKSFSRNDFLGRNLPSALPNRRLILWSRLCARTALAADMAGEATIPVRVEPRHCQDVGPEVAIHPSRLRGKHFQILNQWQ
jgi:hypothetical protein